VIVCGVLLNVGKKVKITGKEKECKAKIYCCVKVLHVRNLLCDSSK